MRDDERSVWFDDYAVAESLKFDIFEKTKKKKYFWSSLKWINITKMF